jgi:hypothetical protein
VITADERDVKPWYKGMKSVRPPIDMWFGAFVQPTGGQFGMLAKPGLPVWRLRPLFNGRFVFQTRLAYQSAPNDPVYDVVQVEPGLVLNAPSAESPSGRNATGQFQLGPNISPSDQVLSLATPSPCPTNHVVMAAMPVSWAGKPAEPLRYGIWICNDDWFAPRGQPLTAEQAGLKLLFDDPDLVDAEPVAVYPRHFERLMDAAVTPPAGEPPDIPLADGSTYRGPSGTLFGSSLYLSQHADAPGQLFPRRDAPYYIAPPEGSIDHVRIWASYRDRFDDPDRPRIRGEWKLLLKTPVTGATFGAQLPSGLPTVLAGFDRYGHVVSWTNGREGEPGARFFAFAGDHYSAARVGGKHFCIGCHPGHSGLRPEDHRHAERVK